METQLEPIKSVFKEADIQKRFNDMLGAKSAGFIVSVINTVTNDAMLAQADRNSILFAAATAATLDLPINPNLGFAYILAYRHYDKNTKTTTVKAQFQLGYKGFIQLAQRSGQFKTINAEPVYEGDLDEDVVLRLSSIIKPKPQSDKIIGYVGQFKMLNGFEKTLYMSIEDLKKHGLKYSQSYKKGYGLWEDNFEAMATKTVLKLLLSKYAPLSIEMQKAVLADQATINDWEGSQLEYPDNTPPTIEEVSRDEQIKRTNDWIVAASTIEQLEQVKSELITEELEEAYYSKRALLMKPVAKQTVQ